MADVMSGNDVIELVRTTLWPALKKERERVEEIDKWYRWDHPKPYTPRVATTEYKELVERSQAPWGRRVVAAVTQQLYVNGFRAAKEPENSKPWRFWQANGMDARQIPIHEAAIAYGLSYTTVRPGKSFPTGDPIPVIRGLDPSQMIAFYEDPAWDDWPAYALRAEAAKVNGAKGMVLTFYDSYAVYRLQSGEDCSRLEYVTFDEHSAGVCPVVRYANTIDLRGRVDGEVEPFIPLFGRIDQTAFDRLVVQRFASWRVRTATGLAEPDPLEGETQVQARDRVRKILAVEDVLSGGPNVQFGTLEGTPLDGFIAAHDADIRALAAVSQTPVHELIGQFVNMSADALAAAEASLTRKLEQRKHTLGESHEQTLRLAAMVDGDTASASDVESQVRWRDMESRSLATAADALGKMATMLGIPFEMLWERLPDWTDQDTERAKKLIADGGSPLDELARHLLDNSGGGGAE